AIQHLAAHMRVNAVSLEEVLGIGTDRYLRPVVVDRTWDLTLRLVTRVDRGNEGLQLRPSLAEVLIDRRGVHEGIGVGTQQIEECRGGVFLALLELANLAKEYQSERTVYVARLKRNSLVFGDDRVDGSVVQVVNADDRCTGVVGVLRLDVKDDAKFGQVQR